MNMLSDRSPPLHPTTQSNSLYLKFYAHAGLPLAVPTLSEFQKCLVFKSEHTDLHCCHGCVTNGAILGYSKRDNTDGLSAVT